MKPKLLVTVVMCVTAISSSGSLLGRGFGGFHGGGGFGGGGFGGGGGGFHGGEFGGGGFHEGGFGGDGAFHGGEFAGGLGAGGFGSGGYSQYRAGQAAFGPGGFGGGRFDAGQFGAGAAGRSGEGFGGEGFQRGGFDGLNRGGQIGGFDGSAPSISRLNSFLGMPTDSGLSAASGRDFGARYSGGARGLSSLDTAAAGERGAAGHVWEGPNGTTIAHGSSGERGAAVGPNGAAAGERGARGTVIKGPDGGVYAHGEAGERGAVAGPRGAVAGARGVGTWHWSAADMRVQGNFVRTNFNHWNAFDGNWYRRYPNAWWNRGFAAGFWTACTWGAINSWFGVDWVPVGYYYGDNITYVDNNVCLDGQPIASTADYYQSAANLAQTGEQADIPNEQPPQDDTAAAPVDAASAQWLPLGVFEAIPGGEKSSKMTFQLAVNKDGIVRGNYFNTGDNNVQQVQGAVDKQTQRITWVVVDRKNVIFDTGLYNLTKDESTILVHEGAGKTEQWTLVRLKQPDAAPAIQ